MSVKFFNPAKKGEIHEMQKELESQKLEKQKNALKRIIGAMTIGKDVSMLFPNVVKCIHTNDLELKKLVYLYVMNYAKSQPDLVILSVNTFIQDGTKNPNPLVRALAIRTMGCIRLQRIAEYLYHPLKTALQDKDPYVRKTAAICVAKLYDISPETIEQQGFIGMLHDLLADSNPLVVSNSLAALSEINEHSGGNIFTINHIILNRLLAALNECSEWGQIVILDALAKYKPTSSREAETVADRVTSRLQHSNSAVVLSTIRILMSYMDHIQSDEVNSNLCKKMSAPLVTLLSKEPEIQYVALRNMSLILQKRPVIQHLNEMKVFFCKYNDPIYVKMEKLEIIIMVANEKNIDQILLEFKEYATAADIEFVRKAIRAIGRCAIKLEQSAERCIHVLLELIENGFNPVVQESIIVIKDIFRKYPNRYESIIGKLCQNLDTLDEPEAKAAMIWIVGEYAKKIANADALLHGFLENFLDEPVQVQLQLLTATVKLFLQKPKNTKTMVLNVLNLATKECDNPDLRDRGFIYWRLLSGGPKAAEPVVLPEKPQINDDTHTIDPDILDDLIREIANVSSVYHKPADTFVKSRKPGSHLKKSKNTSTGSENLIESEEREPPVDALPIDILGLNISDSPAASHAAVVNEEKTPIKVVLPADKGEGMEVSVSYVLSNNTPAADITITNKSPQPLGQFVFQLNFNILGLKPNNQLSQTPLNPGQSSTSRITFDYDQPPKDDLVPTPFLQVAIKNNIKVFYFQDLIPFKLYLRPEGQLEKQKFLELWKSLPAEAELPRDIAKVRTSDPQQLQPFLAQNNIFVIACRTLEDRTVLYLSANLFGASLLLELTFPNGSSSCRVVVKTSSPVNGIKMLNIISSLLAVPN